MDPLGPFFPFYYIDEFQNTRYNSDNKKYPVDKSYDSNRKYTEFGSE